MNESTIRQDRRNECAMPAATQQHACRFITRSYGADGARVRRGPDAAHVSRTFVRMLVARRMRDRSAIGRDILSTLANGGHMAAKILDGKALAARIRAGLADEAKTLTANGVQPG